jgi:phage terminase large subunit-like protein
MKRISWMSNVRRKHQLLGTTFWRSGSESRWKGYTYFFTYEETLPHIRADFWEMPCALGADLSQGDDFCAFTFLFPLRNGAFGVKTRSYITSLTLRNSPGPCVRSTTSSLQKEASRSRRHRA